MAIAIDPVCGMQVRTADAPARATHDGHHFFFCSDRCHARFEQDPVRYADKAGDPMAGGHEHHPHDVVDPVCGMSVDPESAAAHRSHGDRDYWFCSIGCAERFDEDHLRFTAPNAVPEGMPLATVSVSLGMNPKTATMVTDPVCGMSVDPSTAPATRTYDGTSFSFCSPACAARFDADPIQFSRATEHGS